MSLPCSLADYVAVRLTLALAAKTNLAAEPENREEIAADPETRRLAAEGRHSVSIAMGNWFHVLHYEFPLVITVDRLSWPMVFLSTLLTGLVSAFSAQYMHRDPGFFRFFFLLNLFGFGCLLMFTAGALDLLVAGWELVGLTSVLLIGFFHLRPEPVRGAIHVFKVYRLCDIGLLVSVAALHHLAGAATTRTFTARS